MSRDAIVRSMNVLTGAMLFVVLHFLLESWFWGEAVCGGLILGESDGSH